MGDVGSSLLGMSAAAFSLWADREGYFPLWVALLVFSPFIVDATVTLLRRLGRGERVWEAHKSHYYQRLVQLGWGHRRTVLAEYVLMAACALSAFVALYAPVAARWTVLGGWLVVYLLVMAWIDQAEVRRAEASP
jgi:UDP-N-acetylmuramyl pentapeptide phosphotransferase/UDP-N-acetylglucosamine-1-phosphate transferase